MFRVGKEEEISSSSVAGRNDPIQVAHKLLIELRYFGGTSGKKGVQGFVLELPVHMGGVRLPPPIFIIIRDALANNACGNAVLNHPGVVVAPTIRLEPSQYSG